MTYANQQNRVWLSIDASASFKRENLATAVDAAVDATMKIKKEQPKPDISRLRVSTWGMDSVKYSFNAAQSEEFVQAVTQAIKLDNRNLGSNSLRDELKDIGKWLEYRRRDTAPPKIVFVTDGDLYLGIEKNKLSVVDTMSGLLKINPHATFDMIVVPHGKQMQNLSELERLRQALGEQRSRLTITYCRTEDLPQKINEVVFGEKAAPAAPANDDLASLKTYFKEGLERLERLEAQRTQPAATPAMKYKGPA